MADIRLIVTDLDGTLIGRENEFALYGYFHEKIDTMRHGGDCIWVINTGRSLASFRRFYSPMWTMGILPDFIIVDHAYIYRVTKFGFMPSLLWSLKVRFEQWYNVVNARREVAKWHEMITRVAGGVSTIRKKPNRLWLQFDSEESAIIGEEMLLKKARPYRHLKVFRYLKEVDVRYVPFTKGLAIMELGRHLRTMPEDILVIGDGHNDISMMHNNVAGMTGCPANAVPEVIELVHDREGHIASKPSLAGVIEILEAYLTDTVNNTLPANWKHPSETANPMNRKSKAKGNDGLREGNYVFRVMLTLMVIYTVLAVFANFGLLGPLNGIVMMPYRLLLKIVLKLISLSPFGKY